MTHYLHAVGESRFPDVSGQLPLEGQRCRGADTPDHSPEMTSQGVCEDEPVLSVGRDR